MNKAIVVLNATEVVKVIGPFQDEEAADIWLLTHGVEAPLESFIANINFPGYRTMLCVLIDHLSADRHVASDRLSKAILLLDEAMRLL